MDRSPAGFRDRYGPWALIAGASEGIGEAFAIELAARGLNELLIARRPGPLGSIASRVKAAGSPEVRTVTADLGTPEGLGKIAAETKDLEIGLLVCNAASAYTGPYLKAPLAKYREAIDVNCHATLVLIDLAARPMAERRRGGIIVMSSMAAFQGSPYVTVYSATKSFLLSLAEGLSVELKPRGVDVLACCPAIVRTPSYLASLPGNATATAMDVEPSLVAREALAALGRKTVIVPGAKVRLAHFAMTRLMPRRAAVAMLASNTRAMYGDDDDA